MFSALLKPAVDGNNCELHVPGVFTPEKVGLFIEWLPVPVLIISRRMKNLLLLQIET